MITPRQCRAARALLGWTQAGLAEEANIGIDIVRRFERSESDTRSSGLIAIEKALRRGGVKLLNAEGNEGEGVRIASAKA
jgi:ribosome-binding protein aMBF1 (putative translation factor)